MYKAKKYAAVTNFEGCQLPCIPKFAEAPASFSDKSIMMMIKRSLAYQWNSFVKKWVKKGYNYASRFRKTADYRIAAESMIPQTILKKGDMVRVRSMDQIISTLDPFRELKGCAFLPGMHQYCSTEQRVFKVMQIFLDERDYKVKRTRGLILLENNFCTGTPVFGPCDRSCFLFWREEWLEKI